MFQLDKIQRFRDEVNYDKFVLNKYKDVNGKNQWGCICSAMDWITVAGEYIIEFSKKKNIQSMEMYTYISSIDVIWEAVQQLYRVLLNDNATPYANEFECFESRIYKDKDDNAYFKELRASFGAHPVNLKGNNGERLFASWSGDFYGCCYSVILYSNSKDEPYRQMDIYFNEIDAFLKKRYGLLDILIEKIKRQRKNFFQEMKEKVIAKSDNVIEQLYILNEEVKNRGDNDYYKYMIEQLLMIYTTPISNKYNKKMVNEYHKALKPLVDRLYECLQNMETEELEDDILFHPTATLPDGYGYWLEKISNYLSGVGYHPIIWEEKLKEIFNGRFEMKYDSYEEFYVLILASMYER